MALEFEKITDDVAQMARTAAERRRNQNLKAEEALEKLNRHATDWDRIDHCLRLARNQVDIRRLRAARPLDHDEPLNSAIDPLHLPGKATIIAVDGSQILPDRHGPYLYSLINIGIFVYSHGLGLESPSQFTVPALNYPGRPDSGRQTFAESSVIVGMRRDLEEIEALARICWEQKHATKPQLAILDQRLLYWPAAGARDDEGDRILQGWQEAMTVIRECGSLLTGYIVNPGKRSILTMLNALDIDHPEFDLGAIAGDREDYGLDDAGLFKLILEPGQRSKVFVDVSQHNDTFSAGDAMNEVCFFYMNPGRAGRQIARVDLPISAASDAETVAAIHAMIYDQCQILGDYPYALARADEIAVVGRHDQENLNSMIERQMAQFGLMELLTAKQSAKDVARGSKRQHGL